MLGERKLRAAAESARAASGSRWGEVGVGAGRGGEAPALHPPWLPQQAEQEAYHLAPTVAAAEWQAQEEGGEGFQREGD